MGAFTTYGKNAALGGFPGTLYAALHSGAPGADGAANELTGGSPAYARKAVTMATPSGGVRAIEAAVTFDVPAGVTVAHASLWTAATGGSCAATDDVPSEAFTAQGQYKLNTFPLSIADPA